MKKIKASKNKAAQVETRPQMNIENMPIEELADLQAREYEQIIAAKDAISQAQNNLRVIKAVREKR